MKKKCFIFCSMGIGDSLIFLLIANNLIKNGFEVFLYHNFLDEMENWFPYITIRKFFNFEKIKKDIKDADLIIINEDFRLVNKALRQYAKKYFFSKTWVLKATTTAKRERGLDFYLNRKKNIHVSLLEFCKKALLLENVFTKRDFKIKKGLVHRKHRNRIIIHPTGKKSFHKWPEEKYLNLSKQLQKKGYQISYIIPKEEKEDFQYIEKHGIELPSFLSLDELADYVFESGYMIGNNSGISHLASLFEVPAFSVFSSKRQKIFWQPMGKSDGVAPSSWIPNLKFFRIRTKYWKRFVSLKKVLKAFLKFQSKQKLD